MPGRIVAAGDARLEHEIVRDRQAWDQVELLEHEAEPVAPQFGASGIIEAGDDDLGERDLAAVGGV